MRIHPTVTTDPAELPAKPDVVVVGSGAGGAAVAGELARRDATVVVIEAGLPAVPAAACGHVRNQFIGRFDHWRFGRAIQQGLTQHGWTATPPGGVPQARVAHTIGGGLAYWTHHCPTPYADEWPASDSEADRETLLDRARRLLHVGDFVRGGERQSRMIHALWDHGFGDHARPVSPLPVAGQVRDGKVHYSGVESLMWCPPNTGQVSVLAGHSARRLEVSQQRGRTTVGKIGSSTTARIDSAAIVVAAGALGSPQLLMSSGLGPSSVGHYLTDHVMTSCRVTLRGDLADSVVGDDQEFAVWIPVGKGRAHHIQVVQSPLSPEGRPQRHSLVSADIVGFSPIQPVRDNRVCLGASEDGLGMTRVNARFRHSAKDRSLLAAMTADVHRVASILGDTEAGWGSALAGAGGSVHLMGTVRMTPDGNENDSVCDHNGRVWGYSNLFVAGNGVLGSANAGNPTLMTIALALRTADGLLR